MSLDAKTKDSYNFGTLQIIPIIFLMFGNQLVTVVILIIIPEPLLEIISTTNETHVLTYSSPSSNDRHNSKFSFGTFDS